MNRGKILDSWRKKIAAGTPLKGGADFVVVSNVDKLGKTSTSALMGLLPIGDANALSLAAAAHRVAKADGIPVLAGVCATDPLRMMENFLQEMKATGAAGVQNSPSVGLIDGSFRKMLEETRLGYPREVEMIGLAAKADLLTAALAFTADDAQKMAEAGADIVVAHPGLADRKDQARIVADIAAAARSAKNGILVFGYEIQSNGLDGIQTET